MIIRKSNEQQSIKPIICPQCKSTNITLLTEYHKSLILRIVNLLLIVAFVIVSINNISAENDIIGNIFNIKNYPTYLLALVIIIKIFIIIIESKTNIECVCKDCGKTWYHIQK